MALPYRYLLYRGPSCTDFGGLLARYKRLGGNYELRHILHPPSPSRIQPHISNYSKNYVGTHRRELHPNSHLISPLIASIIATFGLMHEPTIPTLAMGKTAKSNKGSSASATAPPPHRSSKTRSASTSKSSSTPTKSTKKVDDPKAVRRSKRLHPQFSQEESDKMKAEMLEENRARGKEDEDDAR